MSKSVTVKGEYGVGRLYPRPPNETVWYGLWWSGTQRFHRSVGPVRKPGTRDGLTKAQARARLREMMAETDQAGKRRALRERMTVADAAKAYVDFRRRQGKKPSTLYALEGHFRAWIVPFLGHLELDKVTPQAIDDLISLMETGQAPPGIVMGRKVGKARKPKTVRNVIGTLNAMFAHALRKRWAHYNPVQEVDLPDIPDSSTAPIRFLTPVEVEAVARAAIDGPFQEIDRALYIVAAMTGLRQGELRALRWRDVDWTVSRIRVEQNYVLKDFGTPKTRRGSRSVPMADRVAAVLERLFQQSSFQKDADLAFGDPVTNEPISNAAILERFRKALEAARLDTSHVFHDLRHTFGTQMAAAGTPMRTLQEWMGHRDYATTMRYADYSPGTEDAKLIAKAFGSQTQQEDEVTALRAKIVELEELLAEA